MRLPQKRERKKGEEKRRGKNRAEKARQEGSTTSPGEYQHLEAAQRKRKEQSIRKDWPLRKKETREWSFKRKEYFKREYQLVQMLLRREVRQEL